MNTEQQLKYIVVGKECPVLGTQYRVVRTSDMKELHYAVGVRQGVVEVPRAERAAELLESIEKHGLVVPFFTWL